MEARNLHAYIGLCLTGTAVRRILQGKRMASPTKLRKQLFTTARPSSPADRPAQIASAHLVLPSDVVSSLLRDVASLRFFLP